MRISDRSAQTDIPVATVKFYLRENLLHPGVRTAVTQAQYEQSHVARLWLIRALLGPGGLSVAAALPEGALKFPTHAEFSTLVAARGGQISDPCGVLQPRGACQPNSAIPT